MKAIINESKLKLWDVELNETEFKLKLLSWINSPASNKLLGSTSRWNSSHYES